MGNIAIKVDNLSKLYRLGEVGTGTLADDLNLWWHRIRGKENPYRLIGEENVTGDTGDSDYVWALKDISFEVEKGEVLGIIGKNGAGKSTLLKILSKVTGPTTGDISMIGRVASLLEVGTGFHPELTGRENIYLNGAILGMKTEEISAKLDEIVAFSGIARYIDTPAKRYSSGMRVRLGFAVAAFLEPEILIVDEVLAVGDAEFQNKAVGKMQNVTHDHGRTVLFVSHNMYSIKQLCDKALVLDNGRIVFGGTADECVQFYLTQARGQTDYFGINSERIKLCKCAELEMEDISIINNSRGGDEIRAGDAITINFYLNALEEISSFGLEIAFVDGQGQQVVSFKTNPNSGFLIDSLHGKRVLTIHIPEIMLTGGTYFLKVRAYKRMMKTFFGIDSVAKLEIKPEDVYHTGFTVGTDTGLLWMKHEWSLD